MASSHPQLNDSPTLQTEEDAIQAVAQSNLQHVAIIMDGNRRWAKQKHLPTPMGHKAGVDALREMVQYCSDIGIKALTVYAFSTENWSRTEEEVGFLMSLFEIALKQEFDRLHKNNVRIRFIGHLQALPDSLRPQLEAAMAKTAGNTGLCLQIATNYGARQEMMLALQHCAEAYREGSMCSETMKNPAKLEAYFEQHLTTQGLPALDLLIRTGGERRLSNFLLWQAAYAELWFTDVLWPDYTPSEFNRALNDFAARHRRFGS